ncbi:putative bifunctional diguanylate cyclase/phosphodiesterase [Notoacmeibacter ruber]|uniref:EAL domain-containing protein n=1 Tax=Notoacmeibacter ruber TaxID=2670375 RepID=A0A3L7JC04_9HYPH|nr:EAL domain-containing protein [Notoacmeibacter ruber]RLQ88166.1 EAL domain-containing protein [Notoacmeibacter ruber]
MGEVLAKILTGKTSDTLVVSQVEALKHRVPILYVVLGIETLAMAITHFGSVPTYLSVYPSLIAITVMVIRCVQWFRARNQVLSPDESRRVVVKTTLLTVLLSVTLMAWSGILYMYPEPGPGFGAGISRRGHIVLFVGVTVVSCIALLMHVRTLAMLTTLLVIPAFSLILAANGSPIEWAVAVNLMLVASAMLYVAYVFSRDFANLVESRAALDEMYVRQKRLASTDSLTQLDNRRSFNDKLEEAVQSGCAFTVLMMDLDGFKKLNDAHGHAVGDQVLRVVAERLAEASEGEGVLSISRMGGDEFAILLPQQGGSQKLIDYGERIIRQCAMPIYEGDLVVTVGASIGINEVTETDIDEKPSKHIERADFALFHAKQTGRGRVELYAPEHEDQIRRTAIVEQSLKSADLEEELHLVFQPVVDARNLQLIGFEVLVRWRSSHLGDVMPGEFIPVAERCGTIHAITRVVLRRALSEMQNWPEGLRLKVNLSIYDLSSSSQMLALLTIIERSGVSGQQLTFEITESAFSDQLDIILSALNMLRAIGSSIAIDDFGTGYSSLSSLHHFRPDLIKIDRSFVVRVSDPYDGRDMIKTIIQMCRNLGARSLAEGVENETQCRVLSDLGCDELQGYWLSRPVSAEKAREFAHAGVVKAEPQALGQSS